MMVVRSSYPTETDDVLTDARLTQITDCADAADFYRQHPRGMDLCAASASDVDGDRLADQIRSREVTRSGNSDILDRCGSGPADTPRPGNPHSTARQLRLMELNRSRAVDH